MAEKSLTSRSINRRIVANKQFTREEFTRILRTCHNIIRNNDKLSPEAAFDEISKILFMKIKYERDQKSNRGFTLKEFRLKEERFNRDIRPELKGTAKDLPYMQYLFEKTKEAYKDDCLFERADSIRIRQNSFEQILEELEKCNLSDAKDDIKGIAFEEFLGKTFRGELGQFFTPRKIVDFMTNILDPQEGETVCDPACGSGGFLIKAFEYIRAQIEADLRKAKKKLRKELEIKSYPKMDTKRKAIIAERVKKVVTALDSELDPRRIGSRMYNLSHNCIFGTDANPRMARTSKMNMIMHGDGHGGVHHHDGLLNVNGIFEERFDVILTNPPFGARIDRNQRITEADRFTDEDAIARYHKVYGSAYDEALKQVNDHIGYKLLSLFEIGSMSSLTEVLFMERCLRLLKKGGRMGIVLPEGVLNNFNLQRVREFFEGRAKIILICSIPQDVFIAAGATVKPSLVFLKRFTEEEERQYAKCQSLAQEECARNQISDVDTRDSGDERKLVKKYFDYEIPIATIDDAGITAIGTASPGNQLPALEKEYAAYRLNKKLWISRKEKISYKVSQSVEVIRIMDGQECVLNGN